MADEQEEHIEKIKIEQNALKVWDIDLRNDLGRYKTDASIANEISKLNDKRTSTIKLFTEDKIDLETYKEMQSIIEEKITKLNEELNNINVEPEEEINMENIKEIITNIKNNEIYTRIIQGIYIEL